MKQRIAIVLTGALLLVSCSELKNGLPAPVAPGVKVHDPDWIVRDDPGFHGKYLDSLAWNDASCQTCHGAGFGGGTSGVSCFRCHPSYPHAVQFAAAAGRHQGYLISRLFPLKECQSCHGPSYIGGTDVPVSCEQAGCHRDASGNPKSPETCNTCHGNFSAAASLTGQALLLSAAPPRDIAGDTATTLPGVGAHQNHLASGTIGQPVKCQECHVVPNSVFDPGHIPVPQLASRSVRAAAFSALVVFHDTLARLVTGNGSVMPAPLFDYNALSCANTYCHGNWRLNKASAPAIAQEVFEALADSMVGAKASPVWTAGSAESQCYSCHGLPPPPGNPTLARYTPPGHISYELTACYVCHGDVVDQSGNIVNKSKHINGVIDLVPAFGGPRPMQ